MFWSRLIASRCTIFALKLFTISWDVVCDVPECRNLKNFVLSEAILALWYVYRCNIDRVSGDVVVCEPKVDSSHQCQLAEGSHEIRQKFRQYGDMIQREMVVFLMAWRPNAFEWKKIPPIKTKKQRCHRACIPGASRVSRVLATAGEHQKR